MITDKYGRSISDSRVNDARELYGLSTDTKPTGKLANGLDIPNGAAFLEIDTGDIYLYNAAATAGSEWVKLGGSADELSGNATPGVSPIPGAIS